MAKIITNWMEREYPSIQSLIVALEAATNHEHPNDHEYVDDQAFYAGSCCATCGWANPKGPFMGCGHNVYEHILGLLSLLRSPEAAQHFAVYPQGNRRKVTTKLLGGPMNAFFARASRIFQPNSPFSRN